jgi:hypothetical protein
MLMTGNGDIGCNLWIHGSTKNERMFLAFVPVTCTSKEGGSY